MTAETPTGRQILATPMDPDDNDVEAATIREYLVTLLATVWRQREGFSGKRPFGSSDWTLNLYGALIKAGYISGEYDENGYLLEVDDATGQKLIASAIQALAGEG
ncbi:hypothetical protein ACIBCT_21065 [Streptosporangium sp. NPDC050855]|uniref:hypothetical protein n=1 Tax=Streptosporangium sp. NPDC050855 TaxID=3366194 RepID=UPI0037942768